MRLIDADALKYRIGHVTMYVSGLRIGKTVIGKILESYRRGVFEEIDTSPTIDPEELRPKGRWIKTSESRWDANEGDFFIEEFYSCSICKEDEERKSPYCPHCGARMEVDNGEAQILPVGLPA